MTKITGTAWEKLALRWGQVRDYQQCLGHGTKAYVMPKPIRRERERVMDGEKHGVIISRLVEMSQHAEGVPQGGILR